MTDNRNLSVFCTFVQGLAAAYFTLLTLSVIAGSIQAAAKTGSPYGCLGCFMFELIGAIVGVIAMADASNNCGEQYEEVACLVPEGQTPQMFAATLVLEIIAMLVNGAMLCMG